MAAVYWVMLVGWVVIWAALYILTRIVFDRLDRLEDGKAG